jgi:hypothetical protein
MITNFDVQKILNSTSTLHRVLESMINVKQGSGENDEIHLWAYKQLLEEISALRDLRDQWRER